MAADIGSYSTAEEKLKELKAESDSSESKRVVSD